MGTATVSKSCLVQVPERKDLSFCQYWVGFWWVVGWECGCGVMVVVWEDVEAAVEEVVVER